MVLEQLKAIKVNGVNGTKPAVKVNDVIGSALPRIGPYKKLNNSQQVVALIDDVRFELNERQIEATLLRLNI